MTEIILDRLVIRRFREKDFKDLHDYLSDEKVVKYEPYGVFSEEETKEELEYRIDSKSFFAVCIKETDKVIGNIYFNEGDFGTWELGFVFNKSYQGYGYATESTKGIMKYAFEELNVRRIVAMCNPENERSWKLLERLKMRREGTLLQNIYFKKDNDGNPIWLDTYEYGILRSEWNKDIN
ncbi:GNAT family N-acetyltransferase [Sedimentibacter sp. zth1]|uniref:GNAT family N-acetyltransferase n=1 Tax=Sedimentibacter sp. zth1 TaxID=2816908 RepID=UPI001A920414|nr:GNAT family protein [Sedimentibacter sp. zth1]QSX06659.1 GNAT family N-acetyltransferase [Sedimentibacter sp. zth1]